MTRLIARALTEFLLISTFMLEIIYFVPMFGG